MMATTQVRVGGGGYPRVPLESSSQVSSVRRPGAAAMDGVRAAVRLNPHVGTLGSTSRAEEVAQRRTRMEEERGYHDQPRPSAAKGEAAPRLPSRQEIPEQRREPEQDPNPLLPQVCGKSGTWRPYIPSKKTVIAIGPGGGTRMNHGAYTALAQLGYDVVPVHAAEYDNAADGSGYAYPPGWEDGTPDLRYNRGRNLATLADDVVLPLIQRLVKEGRGPACVIAGSRGGQVTIPRLWEMGWRGPTLVINGGCASTSQIPPLPVRLLLVTGGRDFFDTKDPRRTKQLLEKQDPKVPVWLYHDPDEGHMPFGLDRVFGGLLDLFNNEALSPLWEEKDKDGTKAALAAKVNERCPGKAHFSLL